MKKLLSLMLIVFMLVFVVGCFSIMRIPLAVEKYDYDATTQTVTTNTVYETIPGYPMCIYPTIHLRYHLLAFAWQPAEEGYKWRKVGGPVASIVSLIGLPVDFIVDTIALPWDWNASETNECMMCKHIETLKRANK